MVDNLLDRRVVTIGGGTGGFILNRGLHAYPVHQTAVVTAFDSGGSSGVLRDEYGALPQGDVRRCMLAMANDVDDSLRELFNYRFPNGNNHSSLSDHSLGNLLLLAAEKKWGHINGIRRVSRLLGIRGQILPVSTDDAHLCAELSDSSCVKGEANIDLRSLADERLVRRVWLDPRANVRREVADALEEADVIVFGPGDLYTSVIPNLLVTGVAEAIKKCKAKVVYVSNLMTKWSETREFDAADFAEEVLKYGIGRDHFDVILVNTTPIPEELIPLYETKDKSHPVVFNDNVARRLKDVSAEVITSDFLSRSSLQQQLVRHGPAKLAKCIVEL